MYTVHMNIYISKALEERLNQEPNKSGLINELLRKHYSGSSPTPPKPVGSAPQELPNKTPRTTAYIMNTIKGLEAGLRKELEFNQDPEDRTKITAQYQEIIDKLWVEWKELND